ncbi:hypothetical protein Sjap_002555 [Stephania japonica]|uniref:Ankyrin repeat protein n=1 Tax=Stephania japonica TaxID=461633 RepID=A0AAP0KN05_9MAGN
MLQMVELLLTCKFGSKLDVLLESSCDGDDVVIGRLLLQARALKSHEINNDDTFRHDQLERANYDEERSGPLPRKCLWILLTYARDLSNKKLVEPEAHYRMLIIFLGVLDHVVFAIIVGFPGNLAEFAKETIRLKPTLASEMNIDGFSPIHKASANGQVELARELTLLLPILWIEVKDCPFTWQPCEGELRFWFAWSLSKKLLLEERQFFTYL